MHFYKHGVHWLILSRRTIMLKITLTLLLFFNLSQLKAQEYIYISSDGLAKILRADIGYTQFNLTPKDSATQSVNAIHLNNEVKILTGKKGEKYPITIYDAFYFNLALGLLSSEPQQNGEEKESSFAFTFDFGYTFLAGYRNKQLGLLGGVDFRWRAADANGITMPDLNGDITYYSRPLVIRGEYALFNKSRVVGTIWYDDGNAERASFKSTKLMFSLGEEQRYWFMVQYVNQSAKGQNIFKSYDPTEVAFTQFIIGLHIGILP